MKLSKKDKSKILVDHLERDFGLVSRSGETYVIMSIMDALSEIESLEGERSEPMNTSGADSTDFRDDPNRETQAEYFGKK